MHIKDGILSPEVCLATGAIALGALSFGLRRLDRTLSLRTVPLTGMMAALIFAGQMVNFPLSFFGVPASGHLLGGVLAAAVVGPWAGLVALALVLFVQMVLFADGGWFTYGANVLNMGVVGSLGGYAVFAAIRHWLPGSKGVIVGSVVASWLSVVAAATLFCIEFGLSVPAGQFRLSGVLALMTSFHSAIGVGEALITGMVLSFIVATRPDLIDMPLSHDPHTSGGRLQQMGRVFAAGLVVALAVAAFLAPFKSDLDDGLEAVAAQLQFQSLEQEPRVLVFEDYDAVPLPGVDMSSAAWKKMSVSLAGILGTLAIAVIAWICDRLMRPRALAPSPLTTAGTEDQHVA